MLFQLPGVCFGTPSTFAIAAVLANYSSGWLLTAQESHLTQGVEGNLSTHMDSFVSRLGVAQQSPKVNDPK